MFSAGKKLVHFHYLKPLELKILKNYNLKALRYKLFAQKLIAPIKILLCVNQCSVEKRDYTESRKRIMQFPPSARRRGDSS